MWPFKRKPASDAKLASHLPVIHQEKLVRKISTRFGMVEIPSLDLLCSSSESPNGNFMIAWADSFTEARRTIGGFRTKGHGSYVLISADQILCKAQNLERPNYGKVADDGTFILIDIFFGTRTTSKAYIFAKNGMEVMRLDLMAKTYDTAISNDGRFAIIQLCGSKNKDSNCLVFVDVWERRILWKSDAAGPADSYHFDNEAQCLKLVYADKGPYEYAYSGEFISSAQRDFDRLKARG